MLIVADLVSLSPSHIQVTQAKIDFRDEIFKHLIVLSENIRHGALIFWHVASSGRPLPSLFKLCPLSQK